MQHHLQSAQALCAQGDYIQAAEKIWGALSAAINAKTSGPEKKGRSDKEQAFLPLVAKCLHANPDLRTEMYDQGFKNAKDLFYAAWGLHMHFYGGANYTDLQVATRIEILTKIIAKF
jgi:hypothetical protein